MTWQERSLNAQDQQKYVYNMDTYMLAKYQVILILLTYIWYCHMYFIALFLSY